MAKSKFKITQFENPSGGIAWRLSGTLNGKRIRENYKTRPEAVAQRQKYDVEVLNAVPEGRTIWTTLTPEENRDAVAAMNSLRSADSGATLSFAVDFFLKHYRPPENEKSVAEAATEYLEKRDRDCLKGFVSSLQLKAIRHEMDWLKHCFPDRVVSLVTLEDYRDYLEKPKNQPNNRKRPCQHISPKTWNNRRGNLNTFCVYCVEKGYLAENPIARLPKHKERAQLGTAETLKAETLQRTRFRRSWMRTSICALPFMTWAMGIAGWLRLLETAAVRRSSPVRVVPSLVYCLPKKTTPLRA